MSRTFSASLATVAALSTILVGGCGGSDDTPEPSLAAVVLTQPVGDIAFSASRQSLLASTTEAGPNANRLVELEPRTGAIRRSFDLGSVPDAISLSADGTSAYVGLSSTNSFRRIDLTTGAVGAPITLGPANLSPIRVEDIVVSPVDPQTVAVSYNDFDGNDHLVIYRNGIAAPNRLLNSGDNDALAFNRQGTELFGVTNGGTPTTTPQPAPVLR